MLEQPRALRGLKPPLRGERGALLSWDSADGAVGLRQLSSGAQLGGHLLRQQRRLALQVCRQHSTEPASGPTSMKAFAFPGRGLQCPAPATG